MSTVIVERRQLDQVDAAEPDGGIDNETSARRSAPSAT
jgi:hypothetical protein